MVLSVVWSAVSQVGADVRPPGDIALAAQLLFWVMFLGSVACPVALYFVCRRQARREGWLRALGVAATWSAAEQDEALPPIEEEGDAE